MMALNQKFENDTIVVQDGSVIRDCEFINCTFVGPSGLPLPIAIADGEVKDLTITECRFDGCRFIESVNAVTNPLSAQGIRWRLRFIAAAFNPKMAGYV